MSRNCYVYILTNLNNTVFYVGVTNNLERRVVEHKSGLIKGFTQKYKLKKLVYFEEFPTMMDAIRREKQLKNWHRDWKLNLIKSLNRFFNDLAAEIPK
ncbi:MAG: GIY-YIG nuclease family protein [Candidatus Curtissbacteria bacterium]|nr:GIY-YIG nuclease family protein [Candidatus Curtissbacteria bacterium]